MPQALLFIPDISGYTQFVTRTEITHQQHIITELLDILIGSNDIDLELAEVEGDALFYYKIQPLPAQEEILHLVKKMFLRFHSHLLHFEKNRICHCGACEGATGLSLKFVIHKGDITFLKLKGQKSKPHGKEVITIHRLLKNNIKSQEYVIVTDDVSIIDDVILSDILEVVEVNKSSYDYGTADIGEVNYKYSDLKPLRKYVTEPEVYNSGFITNNPIVTEIIIDLDTPELFEVMINFDHRLKWSKGLEALEYNTREINKAGTSHICIISDQEIHIDTIKADFGEGKWAFGERAEVPIVEEVYFYYIITPLDEASHLRIEVHPNPTKITGKLLLPIFKWKFGSLLKKIGADLKSYAESTHNVKA